jgi:hypothetical protein
MNDSGGHCGAGSKEGWMDMFQPNIGSVKPALTPSAFVLLD